MGDKWKLSYWKSGMPGLHLTLNPQSPVPPSAKIYRHFLKHNITLSDRELSALLAGREQGIASINALLGPLTPGLGVDTRLKLSTQIADGLMSRSLEGQLSREAPTALQQLEQRDQVLKHLFQQPVPPQASRGQVPALLEKIPPVGVSLTVHF